MSLRVRIILIFLCMGIITGIGYWYMKITTGVVEEKLEKKWRLRDNLLGVSFGDEKNGWAVGQYGTILRTSDGGLNWTYQKSGVMNDIMSIHALSAEMAWAVGFDGLVLHTTDAGKSWHRVKTGMRYHFNDVQFLNPQEGWIVGQYEIILYSSDGGATWQTMHGGEPREIDFSKVKEGELVEEDFGAEEEVYSLNSIFFLNSLTGWAVGEAGIILNTTDGGKTWIKNQSGSKNTLTKVEFFNPQFGFAVGLDSTIIKSTDGGNTWTKEVPSEKTHYFGLTFRRYGPDTLRQDAFAVGQGIIAYYSFLKSAHLQNWMPAAQMKYNIDYNWLYRISFIDKVGEEAVAVGDVGLILRSPSGGHEWDIVWYPEKNVEQVLNP